MSILEQLENIHQELSLKINDPKTKDEVIELKEVFFGKKGKISEVMKHIRSASNEEKPLVGKKMNELKVHFLTKIDQKISDLAQADLTAKLMNEKIDITLPGRRAQFGGLHPIRKAEYELVDICESLGFSVASGPIIEDMFHNFEALNIPETHPSRDMHDTFYLAENKVLRTHTSSVQIRYMQKNQSPIKIIAPGQVFRSDQDRTHSPMFHQLEGLYINNEVTLPELKFILEQILKEFFDDDFPIRYRSSYFPFTEPSFEVDVKFSSTGEWMEVLGAGMVHRNVLRAVDLDPDANQGFAFGLGIDRLAMLKYGISDIRPFYENDIRFLKQGK
ncbi:MAG: phenylalanine--tRNA ligase subunit alpha [Candidatus Margulisiibacteriota bacterium]